MRKITFSTPILLTISLLCSCGAKTQLPDNPVIYEQGIHEEKGCSYLTANDKTFLPYCAYESKYQGDCIGYCDIPADEYSDASRVYIFELKGYSSDEWIIETTDLDNCKEGMILREVNAVHTPEGLESEYEWSSELTF